MFAYCRSNPVRRKDVQGTIEEDCLNGDDKDELFVDHDGGYCGRPHNPLANYMDGVSQSYESPHRGVSGKGWHGDANWRQTVQAIAGGETHTVFRGSVPSQAEAMQLIAEAGGTYMRVEGAHAAPNPHSYPHVNYVVNGIKGTVRILAVEQEGVITHVGNIWR